jgi:iron complex outermembrane receptor protein
MPGFPASISDEPSSVSGEVFPESVDDRVFLIQDFNNCEIRFASTDAVSFNHFITITMNKSQRIFLTIAAYLLAAAAIPLPALALDPSTKEIVVTAPGEKKGESLESRRLETSDAASLISDVPGVSLNTGGGVSSLPAIHGLADDRVMIFIDGCCVTSACANHMNPPMSYISSSNVSGIAVKSGVTPVSYGGDNIGGIIVVESDQPEFANPGEGTRTAGNVSAYYRSINDGKGASFTASVANTNLSLGVTGSIDHAQNYRDGHGDTVTSTYYESRNVGLTFAAKIDSSLVTVKAGHQLIPKQGFVNEWMDMIVNDASYVNIGYKGGFDWGKLDAKAYWRNTYHKMDSGDDKLPINLTPPVMMPYMPMKTRGIDIGGSLMAEVPFAKENILRLGTEFHRFTLDDWWPPVAGSASMSPNTFINISDGRRDRYSIFAEWETAWVPELTTILGVRYDMVQMDADDVQGYNMMYASDATAFNAQDHERNDGNWDASALVRFEPGKTGTYEIGYSYKTRSPNLYERYAWSTAWMASGMVNWFGDGNGYVGNLNLNPEVAHTVSISADWHDSDRSNWQLKVTPYYTYVDDFIGVTETGITKSWTGGSEIRRVLRFTNHNAMFYGVDISGKVGLWDNEKLGNGQLQGSLGYVHGENRETGNSLYHIMPLNVRFALEQNVAGWTNAIELQLVDRKSEVDPVRFEPTTPGYALVNLRTGYQWKNLRVDLGITNLLDKFYDLPLGGINYDEFLASKRKGQIESVAGQGRSFNIGVTQTF